MSNDHELRYFHTKFKINFSYAELHESKFIELSACVPSQLKCLDFSNQRQRWIFSVIIESLFAIGDIEFITKKLLRVFEGV